MKAPGQASAAIDQHANWSNGEAAKKQRRSSEEAAKKLQAGCEQAGDRLRIKFNLTSMRRVRATFLSLRVW